MILTMHQVSCQSLLNHGNFSAGLSIGEGGGGVIRGFLQRFSNSVLNCSKLLVQNVCCREVAYTLPQCFRKKWSVEKSSIMVPVNDVFSLMTFQIH